MDKYTMYIFIILYLYYSTYFYLYIYLHIYYTVQRFASHGHGRNGRWAQFGDGVVLIFSFTFTLDMSKSGAKTDHVWSKSQPGSRLHRDEQGCDSVPYADYMFTLQESISETPSACI